MLSASLSPARNILSRLLLATPLLLMVTTMTNAQEKKPERTISVTGTASIEAEPDIAHLSTGVSSEASTAKEALAANSALMRKVIEGLKSAGVLAKDIQTSGLHVEPRYTSPKPGQAPSINGYRAVNNVRISARDIGKLGDILDQLVTLGANQMHGLSFEVSKADELKDEARRKAVANALRKAKLYAEAAGASVGEVIAISDDVVQVQPRGGVMARSAMAESVPIERGSQSLEARVHVTWALK